LLPTSPKPGGWGGAPPTTYENVPLFDNTSKLFQTRQTLSPGEPKHTRPNADLLCLPEQMDWDSFQVHKNEWLRVMENDDFLRFLHRE
jgi:hypothetical protein